MSENDGEMTDQQTIEELGRLNGEFIRAATELHDAVASVDAGGSFTTDVTAGRRLQVAVDAIDAPMEELLSFLGEIEAANVQQKSFFCPICGDHVFIHRGDPGEPDYWGECGRCNLEWDIDSIAIEDDDSGEGADDEPPAVPGGSKEEPTEDVPPQEHGTEAAVPLADDI